MLKNKKRLSEQEVLSKLMRYCAYQERSEYEVRQKLRELGSDDTTQERIVKLLRKDSFINEKRFAEVFVRGKVSVKRWGVFKIREGLVAKGISSELITKVLTKIDQKVYRSNLEELIEKKLSQDGNKEISAGRLYRFLLSKGYESDLIIQILKSRSLMQ